MRRWQLVPLLVLSLVLSPAVAAGAAPPRSPDAVAPPETAPGAVTPPDTVVGRQLSWLLDVSHRLPAPAAEIVAHLDPAVLEQAGGVDAVNRYLEMISGGTGLRLLRYEAGSETAARALVVSDVGTWELGLAVTPDGLLSALSILPYLPGPASWAELDRSLSELAPRVSMQVSRVDDRDGRCRPVHGVNADLARPLGSAFKLYVLAALAHEIAAGRAGWDEQLALRDDWKSLPSGVLQDVPAGTSLPLRDYANLMIAISDNTAADHLIHRLGRSTVTAQQVRFGTRNPGRNAPFLTTRELFQLKLTRYPALLNAYAALPRPARRVLLDTVVDRLPLPALSDASDWTAPRGIDAAEWFASAADLCRVFAGLDRQARTAGLEPVGEALSANDSGIWLDPAGWSTTWYKGGSEPGVLTMNYLARTVDGRTFVAAVLLSDPAAAIDEAATVPRVQAVVRGALALAAGVPTTTTTAGPARAAAVTRFGAPVAGFGTPVAGFADPVTGFGGSWPPGPGR
ncbi:serine hydrolase [Plantactinospora siamensis]|uniref:Serine hydrolase n=1 Tax=Plantactinospora siamensis TaxID=555372 RepID=A0ABV6P6E4_9ACTN